MQTLAFTNSPELNDSPDIEPDHDSPLLEVVTVQPEDELFVRSKFVKSEKKLRRSEEACASRSSDEETEIIANFIENVEVREASDPSESPDQESTDEYSMSEDPVPSSEENGVKSPAWRMTGGSKPSSRPRKPAEGASSDESSVVLNESDGTNPLPITKWSNRKSKRPKRIIQDMIDISLGKEEGPMLGENASHCFC